MKYIKKTTITLSLAFAVLFISSCGNDNYCIQKSSLRPEGFVLPNLFTALNYKDTFNLNDTLWIKLTIPAKFSANMKSCNLVDNQIEINNDMLVYRSDSVYHNIDDIQNGYIILGDIPRILTKQGSDYNSTFGLVLNNPKITFIGDTTTKYWPTTSQYTIKIVDRQKLHLYRL